MNRSRILISGVGRIGDALARVVAPQEHIEIALWDIDSRKISHSFSAEQLAEGADVIFLCMPAAAVREFMTSIADTINREVIVVSLIKGLEPTTGQTMYELLKEIAPPQIQPVFLGGPMLSGELLAGNAAYGVAGMAAGNFENVAHLFNGTRLHVTASNDPAGVAAVGVLKNVYALGLGIAAALKVGDNALGALTVHALAEMEVLIEKFGGVAATVLGLAGAGDLVATGFSKHSRNRTVGHDLVTTGRTPIPSEGLVSLPLLLARLPEDLTAYPFLTAVKEVVIDHQAPREVFQKIL